MIMCNLWNRFQDWRLRRRASHASVAMNRYGIDAARLAEYMAIFGTAIANIGAEVKTAARNLQRMSR